MYRLTKFGTTNLPIYDYDWDAGTPETMEALVRTVGGPAYDVYGTDDAPAAMPYQIRYQCIAVESSLATIRTTLDALRALRGKRLALYRQPEDNSNASASHWAWARLMQVQVSNTVKDQEMIWQPLTLIFQVLSPWYGYRQNIYAFTLNTSPKSCAIANVGNRTTPECIIVVSASASDITGVSVAVSGTSEWTYDGTIAAGTSLIVDCGAFSVLNNSTDGYADFTLSSTNHKILAWLQVAPGTNTVVVSKTGGGTASSISFLYYDGWA